MAKKNTFRIIILFSSLTLNIVWGSTANCLIDCDCETSDDVTALTVICTGLGLSDVPMSLPLEGTQTLDLSDNELARLEENVFSKYYRLSILILSYNKINVIQRDAFAGLKMLRNVDLSYNDLDALHPETFSHNPVLESVTLSGNPLVYVPEDSPFLVSSSIRSLNLRSCSLIGLYPATFSKLPSLYSLDLDSNSLQTISLDTLQILPELRRVKLGNNRWSCNCDIVDVMRWVSGRRGDLPTHEPIKCLDRGKFKTWWTAATNGKFCKKLTEVSTAMSATDVSAMSHHDVIPMAPDTETSDDSHESWEITSTLLTKLLSGSMVPPVESQKSLFGDRISEESAKQPDVVTEFLLKVDIVPKETFPHMDIFPSSGDLLSKLDPLESSLGTAMNSADNNTEELEDVDRSSASPWNTYFVLSYVFLLCTLVLAAYLSLKAVEYLSKKMSHFLQLKEDEVESSTSFIMTAR